MASDTNRVCVFYRTSLHLVERPRDIVRVTHSRLIKMLITVFSMLRSIAQDNATLVRTGSRAMRPVSLSKSE
jgi:hypothetical protein